MTDPQILYYHENLNAGEGPCEYRDYQEEASSSSSSSSGIDFGRIYYDTAEQKWKIYYIGLGVIAELETEEQCNPSGEYEILSGFPNEGEIINVY